ncbi:autophagy-related protein 28 [Colletotrichum truncatum]|uniref:Autophagy-related protein 28 n=1 Tax=Colletotrichum truncatum TaxID=5467 RepID=A0ACC3YRX1_COLTU|nr:autophagy-related protein 28 [Colletotrichum truncatum]KAF6789937.1 autophagy-related protein 28 [Colletotrichum truncatum]
MAPDSPRFLDRLSLSRNKSPILPLHTSHERRANDYDLDELSPRPDDALLPGTPRTLARMSRIRSPSPADPWDDDPLSPAGSVSKMKPKAMFTGPPPPIAASILVQPASQGRRDSREGSRSSHSGHDTRGLASSRVTFGSILFDQNSHTSSLSRVDSTWRSLQHRERVLQKEVQNLLDMQATGLSPGGGPLDASMSTGLDTWSDSGSSTPTGTFYSTATSKSRMMASLDTPVRATARGDIIPVRQPKSSGPQGLRTARNGLRRSLAALTDLKTEENDYIELAVSQRQKALSYLNKLDTRQTSISAELHSLADDKEEPLAKELQVLGEQHSSLGQEIRELEEKLVGMRNRHRWLERKMEDVHNRREAGLSGYRGALKEVEGEVASLLRRPPIEPLDPDVVDVVLRGEPATMSDTKDLPGGAEFFRMIPARRTLSMARDWWESELDLLQKRKAQVDKDREALDQGAALWQETINLVTTFEKDLRKSLGGDATSKGKQTPRTQQEAAESMLPRMGEAILELEEHLRTAEQNSWNLLICAIGAELEAFREAARLLQSSLPQPKAHVDSVEEPWSNGDGQKEPAHKDVVETSSVGSHPEESDNEVPPDLLFSRLEEHEETHTAIEKTLASSRRDSDNEVPPEFLAEHSNESSLD